MLSCGDGRSASLCGQCAPTPRTPARIRLPDSRPAAPTTLPPPSPSDPIPTSRSLPRLARQPVPFPAPPTDSPSLSFPAPTDCPSHLRPPHLRLPTPSRAWPSRPSVATHARPTARASPTPLPTTHTGAAPRRPDYPRPTLPDLSRLDTSAPHRAVPPLPHSTDLATSAPARPTNHTVALRHRPTTQVWPCLSRPAPARQRDPLRR